MIRTIIEAILLYSFDIPPTPFLVRPLHDRFAGVSWGCAAQGGGF